LAELGLGGVLVPEARGGTGLDALAYALVCEELARADGALGLAVAVHNGLALSALFEAPRADATAGDARASAGDAAAKKAWLERLASGQAWAACALELDERTMPDAEVTEEGGRRRLHGTARWLVPVAGAGLRAALLVVPARVAGSVELFAVPSDCPGLHIEPVPGLGLRAAGAGDVRFDGAEVPAGLSLGPLAPRTLGLGRLGLASVALGLGEAALAEAIAYAKERTQFGQPIAEFQALQWMIADSRVGLDAARGLVQRVATIAGAEAPVLPAQAATAFATATRNAADAGHRALQIHGGYGYTRDFPVERMLRDVLTCEAALGGPTAARSVRAKRELT
jgi:alkylation response protein AidB-like acyl-CoA dehydrogenase